MCHLAASVGSGAHRQHDSDANPRFLTLISKLSYYADAKK